jgi:dienelactone hydrolase
VESAVTLVNDAGLPVRCDVRLPGGAGPFPVIVVLHGFKGFKDWGMFPPTARRLAERGLATVCMNASRNGVGERLEEFTELEEFARNTPRREVADVRTVTDALRAGELGEELDAGRLGLLGHSRGGGTVILAASRDRDVRCVVTWASVASFDRYTDRAKAEWRRRGRLDVPNARTGQVLWLDRAVLDDLEASAAEYDLEAACGRIRAPFLALHGELDEAVDPEDSRRLVAWCAADEKRVDVIPATGHTFGAAHPWNGGAPAWERVVDETAAWFGAHL